jgi:hypothetical protein
LKERKKKAFVPAYNLAVIQLALKDRSAALNSLQQAVDEHDWAILVLAVEPRLDPLRNEPVFQELLKRVKLPM